MDLCDESTKKDRRIQILHDLRQLIDSLYERRPSGSEGLAANMPRNKVPRLRLLEVNVVWGVAPYWQSIWFPNCSHRRTIEWYTDQRGRERFRTSRDDVLWTDRVSSKLRVEYFELPQPCIPLSSVASGHSPRPWCQNDASTILHCSHTRHFILFPYVGDGQRPFRRQTLASTDAPFTSHRNAPTAPPNPAANLQMYLLTPVTEDELSRPPSRP
ncbi:hypothetical protein BJV77DRAFT_595118 [Russula vinacea]|nr:hypothetical protein BJV77DRAFT_595118 [Russula vinacea]